MTRLYRLMLAAALSAGCFVVASFLPVHAVPVPLDLTVGAGNKLDLGFFAAGTTINLSFTGNGDLVDSRYQTRADGSLFVPTSGGYVFANPGESYPALFGGDGINHYVGGGAAYDFTGSGFGFAGTTSTDTTDPTTIRLGAIVATFVGAPVRTDWLFVGTGATLTVPDGGANLYLAVQDTNNSDNHGTYTGNVTTGVVAVPETGTGSLLSAGLSVLAMGGLLVRRCRVYKNA